MVIAQTEQIGRELWQVLGVFGLVLFALGWFSYVMIRRLIDRNDKLEEQRDEMIHTLASVVPLVQQATEVLKTIEPLTKDNVEALREARWALERRREP